MDYVTFVKEIKEKVEELVRKFKKIAQYLFTIL